jgi:Tfp pilus assembly protein PilV
MTINRLSMRGVSLVEALVALAVMAFGMLAVVGVQSTLRHNGDVSKQRSEATRLAQEKMEGLRSFVVADTWTNMVDVNESIAGTNAQYSVTRQVIGGTTDPPAKALRITVDWTDRTGQPQSVTLSSVISSAAPGLSGTLAVRPGTAVVAPVRRPFRRHPSIPVQARDFGTSSAFVPPSSYWQGTAIVFDNVTGLVTGICTFDYEVSNETITSDDIQSCSNTVGQLLSGFVRFQRRTDGPELVAADVEDPQGPALNLRMRIALTSSGHPQSPICFDDANSDSVAGGDLVFVQYFCVVHSNASGLWSGISTIEARSTFGGNSWFISDDAGAGGGGGGGAGGSNDNYRVCRYTSADSDGQSIPNENHPRNYTDVNGNLTNQNFVVIPSNKQCPTDVAANPGASDFINSNTLQHQPAP